MNWTKEDLHTYILIWSARADFIVKTEEIDTILAKIQSDRYSELEREFEKDSDVQRIDKIQSALAKFNYSQSELDTLVSDMKDVFNADDQFVALEQALLIGLKRLF